MILILKLGVIKWIKILGIRIYSSFLLIPPFLLLHFFPPGCDSKCCWWYKKAPDPDQGHITLNFYLLTSLTWNSPFVWGEKDLSKIAKDESWVFQKFKEIGEKMNDDLVKQKKKYMAKPCFIISGFKL